MYNRKLFDTFVHEKRVFSNNLNYLKHVTRNYCIVQVSLITLAFVILFGRMCYIKQLYVNIIAKMLQGMNLSY